MNEQTNEWMNECNRFHCSLTFGQYECVILLEKQIFSCSHGTVGWNKNKSNVSIGTIQKHAVNSSALRVVTYLNLHTKFHLFNAFFHIQFHKETERYIYTFGECALAIVGMWFLWSISFDSLVRSKFDRPMTKTYQED